MYQEIYRSDFVQAFEESRPNQFSREALIMLFDYFEGLEDATGEKIELDVIAICCDFTELGLDQINEAYKKDFEDLDDAADWLADETTVAGVTDSSIVFVQI